MKKNYFLLFLFVVMVSQLALAQCPPPGFPQPGNTCPQAPILCENLNGYCATVNNNNVQQPFPGCNQNVLNNDEWFAFYAGTTQISIQITPSNCTQSNNMGLQGGIYAGCGPPWVAMDLQCPCTQNPFILESSNFVVGQIYWIVLDGCAGNVCDYSITVLSGSTVGQAPANPGPISGPLNVCQNSSTTYNIAPPSGATIYNWTLTPPLGTISNPNSNATVNWGNTAGTTQLCVNVANACYSNPVQSCTTIVVQPVPTATLSGSGQFCQGQSGSVPLTVTFTGNPPWTFVHTINGAPQPPITTSSNPYTLNITQPGTVALQSVSSQTGNCPGTVSGSVVITQTQLNPTAQITSATCAQSNGSIDLTPAGGTAPYTYNWSNGAMTQDISNIPPGTYTVTLTDANGCSKTIDYTVGNQPNNPTITSTTTPSNCDLANGSINISVSGGATPYTFNWSNGATTEDIGMVMPGSYTVTVTGADGCTSTSTINLTNTNPPITINGTITANTTCNGGNGGVNTTLSPATPPGGGSYTYNWSTGATTPGITNLTPGTYTVTVSGGGSCTQTASFTIPDQPNNPSASITPTGSVCDLANGSANLSVNGGVSPYTYLWSNGATTEDIPNLSAGSYTVTVTGANGCTTTASTSVTNNNPPITINGNVVSNTTCNGGNGSITVTVSPTPPPAGSGYTYNWSTGATTPGITDLTPGSYTVTVTAAGSCTASATFTVNNQPNNPSLNPNVTPANCGLSNGSVTLGVSGGVSPYTFNWSNGATTQNITNTPGNSYSVTVTGANGCTAATTITVPDNPILFTVNNTINPNTSCNPATYNGSISITVTPAGTYTYNWSNGNTGTNLTNLAPGSYSVTVSAGGNCTQTLTYTVPNQPNVPVPTPNIVPATCGQSNGSANVTVTGGVSPYTFNWSTGGTTPNIANQPAGNYTVTVTGANSCTTVLSVNITNNNPPITINGNVNGNTSCISGNGFIEISMQPAGNYSILWSTGSTQPSINNLTPGTYSVTVTSGVSCTQSASFTVPDNTQIPFLSPTVTPSICSNPNGAINLSVSGGQAPITYLWSNGSTSPNLSNLTPGGYSVTVTTAAGCTAATSITVPSNDTQITLSGNAFPNTSCTFPNGIVNLSVQPNVPPQGASYTYNWSNGATTQNLQNVPAGTYSVTVSIGPACTQSMTFTVPNAASPPELVTAVTAATCGQNNGSIDLTVNYGTSPFLYFWSNFSSTQDLTNIGPGIYSVTVTDGNDCSATTSVTVVNNNLALNISGTPTANTSCVSANGGINITVTPAGTYNYLWSNSATTEDLNNLAAGTYTVTVTAGGNCSATASFTVANQTSTPQITQNVTAAICGESNGAIDISVTGATPPYSYLWSNSATTQDITNLAPGDYTVTVSGVNGCSSSATINVPNNSSTFSLSGTAQPVTSCISNNGGIDLTITPSGTYGISWSNSATTEDLANLAPGTYTVTVTESGSCTASASFTVTNQTSAPTTSQTITAEVCGQSNGAVDLTVSGGTAPYTFIWSNSATTEDLTNVAAGNYAVTVTGANGCSTTASATVPDNSVSLSVNGTTAANTSCAVTNGGINVSVTPAGSYTYLWSNNATTEDLTGLAGGSYTVTVSAGGNCTAEATFTVASTTLDPVISQNITAAICGESNGGINLTISGGQAPFSFLWSNNATTEDLANLAPGSYTVQVTGGNGCVANGSFTVPNNNVNFAVNASPVANTSCDNPNGSIDVTVTPAGTYSYLWSNNATTEDLTNLAPGTYSVTVSQGLTCSTVGNFTIGNNTNAPNFTQNITPAICGASNGAIDLTTAGGTPPYQFSWSNNATTEDLSGLLAGNFSVTVTGADGCANTGNFNVPDDIISLNITGTPQENTACTNGNGSVDITVTPAGSYAYLWSNNATTEDISSLPDGSYQVTVSAGGTCTSVASFIVPGNQNVPTISADVTASICGAPDGGIDLTVTGGEGPFQFSWSNSATTEDLTGITAGDYDVLVTAANGCLATGTFSVPNNSNTFSFSGNTQANTLCGSGNGSIDLTVTPPGTYNFIWTNNATTEDLSGLTAGTYTVTISDGGSCTASASFTVGNNAPTVSVTGTVTDVLCFGENTGAIVLSASGGVMPYNFTWTPSVTDPSALAAGNYSVVATDASGCTGTANFTIQQPASAVQLSCTQTGNVSLPGATDGSGAVTISGGVAPYTVVWSPGGSQSNVAAGVFNLNNLGEGSYDVEVTDANGCKAICSFTVSTDDCVTAIGSMQTASLSLCGDGCQTAVYNDLGQYLDPDDVLQFILHTGNSNVIVNEIARSSQPTFCFDPSLMSYGTTYYISAAAGNDDGTGAVILSDDCTQVSVGTPVVFNEIPVASVNQPAPLSCVVSQTTLSGTSSIPGSTFSWVATGGGSISGNPNQANVQATAAGTYTLTVTANGCSSTAQVQVTDISTNVVAGIISSPGELLDCTIDEITLTGTATGTGNPTFAWFLNSNLVGTGSQYIADAGGVYQVVVTDPASGCTATESITIDDNTDFPPLFVNPSAPLNCKDTSVIVSGGSPVPGVQFYWATINGTDTTVIGQGPNVPVNAPGTYFLVGTATNGCINASPVTVTGDYTPPSANAGADQTLDCVQTPVTLNGSGSAGVTFTWTVDDPGIVISNPTSPFITVDEEGVYTLTVTSLGNFCTDSDDVEVFQYENVPQGVITAKAPPCFGQKNGSIIVETDPANGPYQYQLNGQSYGGTNVFTPLAPGNYEIQVVDGQGCVWTTSVFLQEPDELFVELGANLVVELGESATLQAQVSVPLSQLDTILWTPPSLFPCDEMPCDVQEFFPTQQTSVGVTVVDTNGCKASDVMALFVSKERQIYIPNAFSPNGDGTNDVFMIFAGSDVVQIKSFLVFSRWGETVFQYYNFEPNNPAYGWDGKHRGEYMNPAVFAWFATVEFIDGREIIFEGDVSLMR